MCASWPGRAFPYKKAKEEPAYTDRVPLNLPTITFDICGERYSLHNPYHDFRNLIFSTSKAMPHMYMPHIRPVIFIWNEFVFLIVAPPEPLYELRF